MPQTIGIIVNFVLSALSTYFGKLSSGQVGIDNSFYEFNGLLLVCTSVLLQYREELRVCALWSSQLLLTALIYLTVHKWHDLSLAVVKGYICATLGSSVVVFLVNHRGLRPLSLCNLLNNLEIRTVQDVILCTYGSLLPCHWASGTVAIVVSLVH